MLKHYMTLSIGYPTTDEEVRQAYLDLVKRFPPESCPTEFAEIAEAYEALKNESRRIRTALVGFLEVSFPEEQILSMARLCRLRGGRIGLADLIEAEKSDPGIPSKDRVE